MGLFDDLQEMRFSALRDAVGPFEWRMCRHDWLTCKRDLNPVHTCATEIEDLADIAMFGDLVTIDDDLPIGGIVYVPLTKGGI